MANYRFYRLDGSGKIINAEWLEADSDDDALRKADTLAEGARYELWERARRVAWPEASGF